MGVLCRCGVVEVRTLIACSSIIAKTRRRRALCRRAPIIPCVGRVGAQNQGQDKEPSCILEVVLCVVVLSG